MFRHHRFGLAALAVVVLALAGGLSTPAATDHTTHQAGRIATALALAPGSRVADVGAGDGTWSVELARRVGDDGHVWATEVDEDEVAAIRRTLDRDGLDNVTVVVGDQHQTGLPEGCCEAILLRLVYHHFERPAEMRASLRRALRPGGRLLIVDITPQKSWRDLPAVPDRGGHGIRPKDLIREMTGDGFAVVERIEDWDDEHDDHYAVVFRAQP